MDLSLDAETTRKLGRLEGTFSIAPAGLAEPFEAAIEELRRSDFLSALWSRDPSAWSDDPVVQRKISQRLGWMTSPCFVTTSLPRLRNFAESVRRDGFTDVVLLGMGGSSLAPEVFRAVLVDGATTASRLRSSTTRERGGWPRFQMLDSVDPDALRYVNAPLERTLFLLASKSGGTIEPNMLAAYFIDQLRKAGVSEWPSHFVVITDEGTPLHRWALAEQVREIFINPSDIGGRYSALSLFGAVPAAVMGLDVAAILGWSQAMLAACAPNYSLADNPAIALGAIMGAAARAHRDKLTLVAPPIFEPFGLWVEQLVAESTGKDGRGIVPIVGEGLPPSSAYGTDRLFVRLRLRNEPDEDERDRRMTRLSRAGAPIVHIDVPEPAALGAEFMRWEIATATAAALLRINPFDEPNVQQAKDATRALLDAYLASGRLPAATPPHRMLDGTSFTLSAAARVALGDHGVERFLSLLRPGDYFGLLGYLGQEPRLGDLLRAMRQAVFDRTGCATMFGYGPRYLHSTGQLHKGGPNTGVFLIVTAAPSADVEIPNEKFSFGVLEMAQALGDFASLDAAARRVLHIHLPRPEADRLERAFRFLEWP